LTDTPKPNYEVKFIDFAKDQVRDLDGSVKTRVYKACSKKLAVSPDGYGTSLSGPSVNYWKYEFGSHRIVYRIYEDLMWVVVCYVGPRKQGDVEDVYRQLLPLVKAGKIVEQLRSIIPQRPMKKDTEYSKPKSKSRTTRKP
jgi:mRNA-degrading endonuclease RelE of RelBE toxin-antitoxin system